MSVPNEHIIYAFGAKSDGTGNVLLIGIATPGLATLRERLTLTIHPPEEFRNVVDVVIFHEPTKEDLKNVLRSSGLPFSEVKLREL